MKSKEILDKNAKEILKKILSGESLTKIQDEYKVEKGTITDYYRNLFKEDERALEIFDKILKIKQAKTSTIEIKNDKLEEVVEKYFSGIFTQKEAASELGMHPQTFKKKLENLVSQNEKLNEIYESKKKEKSDYSDLNFTEIIIDMLDKRTTQRDIETKYNLKPKTLSKKISKLKDNKEFGDIYKACKILAESSERKDVLNNQDEEFISEVVKKYNVVTKNNEEKNNEER